MELTTFSTLFFGAAYYLGILLISNWIILKIKGFTLFGLVMKDKRELIKFILVCIFGGAIFSFIACDLGGF
jgi:hypothetical protein